MNPERSNERASEDRMGALLQEKKRIDAEIEELEQRKAQALKKARPQKIRNILIASSIMLTCLSGLVLLGIYIWQPLDVYATNGKIVKSTSQELPECGVHKDKSSKLYYPEKCGDSIKYYEVNFTDDEGRRRILYVNTNEHSDWEYEEKIKLPSYKYIEERDGTVLLQKLMHDYDRNEYHCNKAGCEVFVYYLKKRWLGKSNILKPIIELRIRSRKRGN